MSLPEKVDKLMATLEAAGVRFLLREGRLVLDAPVGMLTAEVRAAVSAHRVEIGRLVAAATTGVRRQRLTPRPVRPCFTCGATRWWRRSDGGWVCGVCYPRPRTTTEGPVDDVDDR